MRNNRIILNILYLYLFVQTQYICYEWKLEKSVRVFIFLHFNSNEVLFFLCLQNNLKEILFKPISFAMRIIELDEYFVLNQRNKIVLAFFKLLAKLLYLKHFSLFEHKDIYNQGDSK